jgi:putative endonuclease
MFFCVYALENIKNGNFYIGRTKDLKRRLKEHNYGLVFSTKPYRPWQIIFCEAYKKRRRREKKGALFKNKPRKQIIKAHVKRIFLS